MNTPTDAVTLPLYPDEREVLEEIRVRGAYRTDQDVLRVSLYLHAVHFEIPMAPHTFAIGRQSRLFDDEVGA